MDRRWFLSLLASIPFLGRFVPAERYEWVTVSNAIVADTASLEAVWGPVVRVVPRTVYAPALGGNVETADVQFFCRNGVFNRADFTPKEEGERCAACHAMHPNGTCNTNSRAWLDQMREGFAAEDRRRAAELAAQFEAEQAALNERKGEAVLRDSIWT
jgi:hypothetical protein